MRIDRTPARFATGQAWLYRVDREEQKNFDGEPACGSKGHSEPKEELNRAIMAVRVEAEPDAKCAQEEEKETSPDSPTARIRLLQGNFQRRLILKTHKS